MKQRRPDQWLDAQPPLQLVEVLVENDAGSQTDDDIAEGNEVRFHSSVVASFALKLTTYPGGDRTDKG